MPLELARYPAESATNRRFTEFNLAPLDFFYLPLGLTRLVNESPAGTQEFIEDDNRSAILPDPIATLDGVEFFLSVKGVGSTIDPYSWRQLDQSYAAELVSDPVLRRHLLPGGGEAPTRVITGELWLRGSPYGGQGLEHATSAMIVSERANLTSIHGFLIAPVVKICFLPRDLEEKLRAIHWYRTYRGRMVQELRLVPSNVRIYFHSRSTVGNNIRQVFDQFGISSAAQALRFETRFLRSGIAMLTLFARTLTLEPERGRYGGLDFHDVWLDKDAVLAPDGSVYFVDLEGIAPVWVERGDVREKIEDQVFRSLYELMFAYEQIERERRRRFGGEVSRKGHFETVLGEALREDPFVRLAPDGGSLTMEIRNPLGEEGLYTRFPMLDRESS